MSVRKLTHNVRGLAMWRNLKNVLPGTAD